MPVVAGRPHGRIWPKVQILDVWKPLLGVHVLYVLGVVEKRSGVVLALGLPETLLSVGF